MQEDDPPKQTDAALRSNPNNSFGEQRDRDLLQGLGPATLSAAEDDEVSDETSCVVIGHLPRGIGGKGLVQECCVRKDHLFSSSLPLQALAGEEEQEACLALEGSKTNRRRRGRKGERRRREATCRRTGPF